MAENMWKLILAFQVQLEQFQEQRTNFLTDLRYCMLPR
jgi:hypothetical protein